MKLKVFTLSMNLDTGFFDDQELSEFQLGKDIIEISEHFLIHEKTPKLILILRYREISDGMRQRRGVFRFLLPLSHGDRGAQAPARDIGWQLPAQALQDVLNF